jgi:hypothetical protein
MTFFRHHFSLIVIIALTLIPVQCLKADILVNNFNDIVHWTGSGSNRAALAIDWGDSSAPLVWGFRFNGTATGEDMLKAIVVADARLYAKVQFFNFGGGPSMFVHGIGYDRDGDGFAVDSGDNFGATGLLVSGSYDDAIAVDLADSYRETNFTFTQSWGYYEATGFNYPTTWASSMTGVTGRQLTDLSWDGWHFNNFVEGPRAAFAAVPEPSSLVLLGIAGVGSVCWRRYKRKQNLTARKNGASA